MKNFQGQWGEGGRGGGNSLYDPPSGNVKIQKLKAKHIFECFEKRKGEDGKK